MDGVATFTDQHGAIKRVLVNVKIGRVTSQLIRELKGHPRVSRRRHLCSSPLPNPRRICGRRRLRRAPSYSEVWNRDYQRLQILTIWELLEERRKPDLAPFVMPTSGRRRRT